MKTWPGFAVLLCLLNLVAVAKRLPAPFVPPITHEGIIYTATGGETAYVVAKDEKTGAELWKAQIYQVKIDPLKEADVQMIFIKGMLLSDEKLLIQDEAGRCYRLDLATQKVQGVGCKRYRSLKAAK